MCVIVILHKSSVGRRIRFLESECFLSAFSEWAPKPNPFIEPKDDERLVSGAVRFERVFSEQFEEVSTSVLCVCVVIALVLV